MRVFTLFDSGISDECTDERTDKATYTVASPNNDGIVRGSKFADEFLFEKSLLKGISKNLLIFR